MRGGELTFQLELHRTRQWIVLPITLANNTELALVLDTGSAISAISPTIAIDLLALGHLEPTGANRYPLKGLTAQGVNFPDLRVAVFPRLARFGADGLLGLDFLRLFRRIHFDVDSLQLVLETR